MAKVLIVDDSISMRKLVQGTLEEAGHTVTAAEDGAVALGIAQSDGFDCVVTDVNMPNMDGLTLLGELRKLGSFKFTPILVLTTEMDPEKKADAKEEKKDEKKEEKKDKKSEEKKGKGEEALVQKKTSGK